MNCQLSICDAVRTACKVPLYNHYMLGSIAKPHIFAIFIRLSEFCTRCGTWTAGPLGPTVVTLVMVFSFYQFILPGKQALLQLS